MNVGDVLLDILVVLVAARVAAEVAERIRLPAVVGEITAGVLIGPSVFDLVGGGDVLRVLAEIGVIVLLLEVGLQMDLTELRAVGRASFLVAVIGVVAPFALGWAAALALGQDADAALFIGAALTATSIGITARVFGDMRALATSEARTVLGAAVVDDVMGLVLLTVVVRIAVDGSVSLPAVLGVIALAVAFLAGSAFVGVRLAPPLVHAVHHRSRSAGALVAVAFAFALAYAELARRARLAPIVGAIVAGLSLARSDQADRIRREITPVGHLLVPVFFVQIGLDVDVGQFASAKVLGLAAVLLAAAVVGKLLSPVGALGSPGDKRLIGLGMLPRGEVGLIFAGLGLTEGILGDDGYAALLLVVLATTVAAPPLLRRRVEQVRAGRRVQPAGKAPEGGWLVVTDGVVDLAALPGDHLALDLALQAALLVADHRPGTGLLDWLGSPGDAPLEWDEPATSLLFQVLREGDVRSWRFLEVSGVLDRALPELAETFRRRRADRAELDPDHSLRWSLVEQVREEMAARPSGLDQPQTLLLAALVLESAGDGESPVDAARRLAQRLGLEADAEQELALLVGDSGLLRAASARPDRLREEAVLPLAVHLDSPERARALYVLSLALGELEPAHRHRLADLHAMILATLARAELTGTEARNLLQRRRAEAAAIVGERHRAATRIAAAPVRFVLAQESDDIARAVALLDPIPPRGRVRVQVTTAGTPLPPGSVGTPAAGSGGSWRVDVASRDQQGLLALVTGVLAMSGLDVVNAALATWPDGAALESFLVTAPSAPRVDDLELSLDACFGRPQSMAPVPDAVVTFESEASPWYTLCEVRAPDRPGLLHSLAVALAAAGADVHTAAVTTAGGQAWDRFELTDRVGAKLTPEGEDAIRNALVDGVSGSRRRLRSGPRKDNPRKDNPKEDNMESKHPDHNPETGAP